MSALAPVLSVRGVRKVYAGRAGGPDVVAIAGASFDVAAGMTLGVIGESGSGKSTLGRSVLGLSAIDSGSISVLGTSLSEASQAEIRALRAQMQIVFQEPQEALNPRMRVGDAIAEPLRIHTKLRGGELTARVQELLEHVMLDPALAVRYPHELSGGQQQRINIARAVATKPKLVVLDEPTASLDVSVRAGILTLLAELQKELGLAYVLISHDLPTIRSMCDEVMVMYRGAVVEHGPAERVLGAPEHPYTAYLMASDLPLDPAADLPTLPDSWQDQPTPVPTTQQ